MKQDKIYNRPHNEVLVKSQDGKLYIICHKEKQMQQYLMTFEVEEILSYD